MQKIKKQGQVILKSINEYGKAYENLDKKQRENEWIVIGDQKTGAIGEFYTFVYLRSEYGKAKIKYTKPSHHGWDIEVINGNKTIKVEVKTVSEYSKNRGISPIHSGWDELHLVYLDKKFDPKGFWIINNSEIMKGTDVLRGGRMPILGKSNTGSEVFEKKKCLLSELISSIELFKQGRLKPPD